MRRTTGGKLEVKAGSLSDGFSICCLGSHGMTGVESEDYISIYRY